jgi:hypothetical protein
MRHCSRRLLSTLVLLSALGSAHAAELGEARVSSHIGQPLVADIELAMIDDPSAAVSVRLASPEVYNGAGITVPPALASVNMSVMRRNGRQFLHVTTLRQVDSEHLHLYLELVDKGQRAVRLATLWLTPDPNPAPAPAPAPIPVPVPVPAAVTHTDPAPKAVPVAVAVPPRKTIAVRKPAPAADVEPKASAPQPLPLPIQARQAAAPAACARSTEQASVCVALDGKNAELKKQIGVLEGKVKSLQASLGAPAPAPAAAAASAAASASAPASAPAPAPEAAHKPTGPKPISAIKPLVPRKPKTPPPEPESGLPWGWIGGAAALLLASGAALLLRRRKRTVRNVDIPAAPRLIERLRQRIGARSAPAAKAAPAPAPEAVEPTFE